VVGADGPAAAARRARAGEGALAVGHAHRRRAGRDLQPPAA
jgi:hypothetical protein